QVLYTTATDQNDGVFLQVVADTGDVSRYLNPIGQTHTCNFAQGRIRLLGCGRIHASANASFLRTLLQCRTTRFVPRFLSSLSNELIKSRHEVLNFSSYSKALLTIPPSVKPFDITQGKEMSSTMNFVATPMTVKYDRPMTWA